MFKNRRKGSKSSDEAKDESDGPLRNILKRFHSSPPTPEAVRSKPQAHVRSRTLSVPKADYHCDCALCQASPQDKAALYSTANESNATLIPTPTLLELVRSAHAASIRKRQDSVMNGNFLNPRAAAGTKLKQVQDAKNMQQAVLERASRKGLDAPAYEFLELIGKGSFGRVYKCKSRNTQQVVAVKISEIDSPDYEAKFEAKDDTIKDFIKEITVLQQLKDSGAQNVNIIYEAFSFTSQLWIVSEYCPGGSVHTLMRATPRPGLEESFIIPIARELAIALKFVHEAGIIHRDVKCANILITEDGRLQLCDFGIAGVLESEVAKRSTIIGTPNWMPPEMVAEMFSRNAAPVHYGTEVDCWAYGCAVYEMATGLPPHTKVHPYELPNLIQKAPRLEGGDYSQGLRDFVSFCLEEKPQDRPSAAQILQHNYIANTSTKYPTETVRQLVERYAKWEQAGGQRISLFNPYGAAAPELNLPPDDQDDDWNFSTTMEFDRQFARKNRLSDPFHDSAEIKVPVSSDIDTPTGGLKDLTPLEKIVEEAKIRRGGRALNGIFNPTSAPYKYGEAGRRTSDLPFRDLHPNDNAADRKSMIDLDEAGTGLSDVPSLDLEGSTLRAKRRNRFFKDSDDEDGEEEEMGYDRDQTARRATRDWKMPVLNIPSVDNPKRRTQDWTFPRMISDEKASYASPPKPRRLPRDLRVPKSSDIRNRRTQDWTFPKMDDSTDYSTSADEGPSFKTPPSSRLRPAFRPQLRHAATMPVGNDLVDLHSSNTPESPQRTSMIDLDLALAVPEELSRPPTAGSVADSTFTDMTSGDPFDLEDQMQLMKGKNRTSFHMKSQSEPAAHTFPDKPPDDREYGSDHGPTRHSRGFSHDAAGTGEDVYTLRPKQTGLQRHWQKKAKEFRLDDAEGYLATGFTDSEYESDHWSKAYQVSQPVQQSQASKTSRQPVTRRKKVPQKRLRPPGMAAVPKDTPATGLSLRFTPRTRVLTANKTDQPWGEQVASQDTAVQQHMTLLRDLLPTSKRSGRQRLKQGVDVD